MTVADVEFTRPAVSRYWFIPGTTHPTTAAAVNAGTELTDDILDVVGFSFTATFAELKKYGTNFKGKVASWKEAADSALKFAEKRVTNTLRSTLAEGTSGIIAEAPYGTAGASAAAGDKIDSWLVTVASTPREHNSDAVAAWQASMSVAEAPHIDVALT